MELYFVLCFGLYVYLGSATVRFSKTLLFLHDNFPFDFFKQEFDAADRTSYIDDVFALAR